VSVTEAPPLLDAESREWLHDLRAGGAAADEAVARLNALLLRAARFEVTRRSHGLPHIRDADDVAVEAAADALHSVRARLDDYRGDSRFTTWASKFAVLETAVKLRRRAWQGRELPTAAPEQRELSSALQDRIARLPPHQREVVVALALNGVPIDVLADRLGSTRGALYETLHDARKSLRRHVVAAVLS
jgi:RNA polymerase sigma-70 factor (ECF subfamily)